ncbi:MAG: hypothetical protein JWM32_1824 [Verrucomicrobia bacterium]|nr:hypothetical protein [Verrucomicrobiota bacterium]
MPDPKRKPVRRSPSAATRGAAGRGHALMVIDHGRLQGAAWAEFHSVRKRLEKTTRELHRHEEVDVPAYNEWLHRTFPVELTTMRELHEEVATKSEQIEAVQARAAIFGGSLKRLWREQKERAAAEREPEPEAEAGFEDDGTPGNRHHMGGERDFDPEAGPKPSRSARDIYRRLVQRLHPDRGGGWTHARQHLWHQVQQAWAAADADWLARLEVEWESANEVLGPASPISRLRRAIEELVAARRDLERKLHDYRVQPAWRFTKNKKDRPALERRTRSNFEHDINFLRRQLTHFNATIAAWEEDWTRSDTRLKARPRRRRPGW